MRASRFVCGCVVGAMMCVSGGAMGFGAGLGDGFSYQGKLVEDGMDADGSYDFRFTAIAADGGVLGGVIEKSGVVVEGGVFSVMLDFGDVVFADPGAVVRVEVRGVNDGDWVVLSPDTAIGTVARSGVSELALEAESLVDPIWTRPSGGRVAGGDGASRLIFNRDGSITGSDFFTLGIPDHGGAYGGMYVDAFDADQIPFYGFSVNGSSKAWIEYRDADEVVAFRFASLSASRLTVTREGVEMTGDVVAKDDVLVEGEVKKVYSGGERFGIGPKYRGAVNSGGMLQSATPNVVDAEWKVSTFGDDVWCEVSFAEPLGFDAVVMVSVHGDPGDNYYGTYSVSGGKLEVSVFDGGRTSATSVQRRFSFLVFED